ADVLVKATLKVPVAPGASVSEDGLTTVVTPVTPATDALYVEVPFPTLVTVRVTVCVPARSPIAIDGTFRSLGSMRIAGQYDAVSWPVPHRKASHWLKPWSKTRPGSAALSGL